MCLEDTPSSTPIHHTIGVDESSVELRSQLLSCSPLHTKPLSLRPLNKWKNEETSKNDFNPLPSRKSDLCRDRSSIKGPLYLSTYW